jgi:sulfopropanediol 3-dehydrogenase
VARIYLKQAPRPLNLADPEVGRLVGELLEALEAGGEPEARRMASEYDGWTGPVEVDEATVAAATAALPTTVVDDMSFAHRHIRDFARAQRDSMTEFSVELFPGLVAGQRLVPVEVAGCYVPAGRFAHVASALMGVTTAVEAGVADVVVTSPARPDRGGVHPAILHAAHLAGATRILGLGGVQGVGALAYGLFTGAPADVIVGPGNSLVAEAKRRLFGRVGIDVVAGPTESMVVADETADPATVAVDLVGQAEHGPDSPVWLVTTSRDLGAEVVRRTAEVAETLPDPARASAVAAWRDHGEVVVVDDREEAAVVADEYAPEHLQVMADDLDWWRERLRNYGSLFLGERTTVTFGDKTAGPNHILPTGRAARYSGGLNVHRFIKQLTWQEMSDEAAEAHAVVASRISRLEGMEGHARSADLRAGGRNGNEGRADR